MIITPILAVHRVVFLSVVLLVVAPTVAYVPLIVMGQEVVSILMAAQILSSTVPSTMMDVMIVSCEMKAYRVQRDNVSGKGLHPVLPVKLDMQFVMVVV